MSRELTAQQLVAALAQSGYFDVTDFDPARFTRIVEGQLGVGTVRALDILAASGLTTFEYTSDPGLHPRDTLDWWRVSLTSAGKSILSEERAESVQTSNNSLQRP
jgi:hypothetical protein